MSAQCSVIELKTRKVVCGSSGPPPGGDTQGRFLPSRYKKFSVLLGSKGHQWYHACTSSDVPSSRSSLVDVLKDLRESFLNEISVRMPSL